MALSRNPQTHQDRVLTAHRWAAKRRGNSGIFREIPLPESDRRFDSPGTRMDNSFPQKASFKDIRHSYGFTTDSMTGKPLSSSRSIISDATSSMIGDRNIAAGMDRAVDSIKKTDLGFWGNSMRSQFPKQYDKMANSVLDAGAVFNPQGKSVGKMKDYIHGASMTGNKQALADIGQDFKQKMLNRRGLSMSNRFLINSNLHLGKSAMELGGQLGRGANVASKAVLGASLGQIGFAGAVVAGLGYAVGSSLGVTRQEVVDTATAVNEGFKSRPQYGQSQMGQSTQGLVFGLHAARRR
jgi:hypothetical protein